MLTNIIENLDEESVRVLEVLACWNKKPVPWVIDAVIREMLDGEEKARLIKEYIRGFSESDFKFEYLTLKGDDSVEKPKADWRPLPDKLPDPAPLPDYETPEKPITGRFKVETVIEKPRKKPGRKPKTLKEFVDGTAKEVRQAEKMSKDEFVEFFGGK